MDYKNKSVLVVDNGIFVEIAVALAKSFGKVMYYSPWEEAYVKSNNRLVGAGLPGIERVNDIFGVIDDTDLFVFPDLYHAGLQLHLESLGKRVWGSRMGEEIELERDAAKKYLKKLGLPVGKYRVIKGLDDLRKYLKEHDNVFVKVSVTRGDCESFSAKNYKYIETRLDELEHNLGMKKKITEFIVEDAIDGAIELGYDGYTIDGQYPTIALQGIEVKDKGYIGHVRAYKDTAKELTEYLDAIAPALKKYRYRNFKSTENRITQDHTSFMNDATCRCPSPPSEMYSLMFENLADIIWNGADGKCIDPEIKHEWAAEVIIDSFWSDKNWQMVQFPEKIRDNVKLRQFTMIDGEYYVIPQNEGSTTIGAAVATGDTMDQAIENVKVVCGQIVGYNLQIHDDALDDAQKEIDNLKEMGIEL